MENPATWGEAEKVVNDALDAAREERELGMIGLSAVRQVTDALREAGLLLDLPACTRDHRGPEGPNEGLGQCPVCWSPSWEMRPEDEQFGFHFDDCSLPRRHEGYCKTGGDGHPIPKTVRGYWGPNTNRDIAYARKLHGNI